MLDTIVNTTKTWLSRLAARKRIGPLPPDDPLLNLDEFAVEGAGGELANAEIDRLLYGGE